MERYHPSMAKRIDTAVHMYRLGEQAIIAAVPGCTPALLHRWRTGQALPPDHVLPALARALGLTEQWLRSGDRQGTILRDQRKRRRDP